MMKCRYCYAKSGCYRDCDCIICKEPDDEKWIQDFKFRYPKDYRFWLDTLRFKEKEERMYGCETLEELFFKGDALADTLTDPQREEMK